MKLLTQNKYWKPNKDYNIDKILYLLIDRPNEMYRIHSLIHSLIWYNEKGQYHRDYDLPSYSSNTGFLYWYKNGKLHRENNKPAKIWFDGEQIFYKDGNEIFNE